MRANNIAFNHNSRGWKDLFIIEWRVQGLHHKNLIDRDQFVFKKRLSSRREPFKNVASHSSLLICPETTTTTNKGERHIDDGFPVIACAVSTNDDDSV